MGIFKNKEELYRELFFFWSKYTFYPESLYLKEKQKFLFYFKKGKDLFLPNTSFYNQISSAEYQYYKRILSSLDDYQKDEEWKRKLEEWEWRLEFLRASSPEIKTEFSRKLFFRNLSLEYNLNETLKEEMLKKAVSFFNSFFSSFIYKIEKNPQVFLDDLEKFLKENGWKLKYSSYQSGLDYFSQILYLPVSFADLPVDERKSLILHEFLTHFLRYYFGKLRKDYLSRWGSSEYLFLEEGLALFNSRIFSLLDKDILEIYRLLYHSFRKISPQMNFVDLFYFFKDKGMDWERAYELAFKLKLGFSYEGINYYYSLYWFGYQRLLALLKEKQIPYSYFYLYGKINFTQLEKLLKEGEESV